MLGMALLNCLLLEVSSLTEETVLDERTHTTISPYPHYPRLNVSMSPPPRPLHPFLCSTPLLNLNLNLSPISYSNLTT